MTNSLLHLWKQYIQTAHQCDWETPDNISNGDINHLKHLGAAAELIEMAKYQAGMIDELCIAPDEEFRKYSCEHFFKNALPIWGMDGDYSLWMDCTKIDSPILYAERTDVAGKRAKGSLPKPILKSLPENGHIKLDADTTLTGIPIEAWEYRLGNRSALDWVLDQHKEKKPRDPTIREKFNTYRFADYKDHVIDLLGRVARVSVDTVKITDAMSALDRSDWD